MLEFPDGKRLPGSHSRHHSKDRSKLAINGDESSIPRRKSERVLRPKYHHHHKHHRRKAVRIILKPLKPPEGETNGQKEDFFGNSRRPQTISEILASLHGKQPRRRLPKRNRKLSLKGLERRSLSVDLETPDSKLVHVNPKNLINKHTFNSLPLQHQYKLLRLLPEVDTVKTPDSNLRLRAAALDNEFFAKACSQWRTRLKNGEFTPEMQARLQQELMKERSKVDPWKRANFEPFWGQSYVNPLANLHATLLSSPPKKSTRRSAPVVHCESRTSTKHSVSEQPPKQAVAARQESVKKEKGPRSPGIPPLPPPTPPGQMEVKPERHGKIILKLNLKEVKAAAAAAQNAKHLKMNSPKKSKQRNDYVCSKLLTDIANATQKEKGFVEKQRSGAITGILNTGRILPSLNLKRPGEALLPRGRGDVPLEKRIKQESEEPPTSLGRGLQRPLGSPQSSIVSARTVAQVKGTGMKQGQTRTLAQIKTQMLAKVQAAHGQTKTLAQIKAQTSAKLQQRSPPERTARPYGHVPTILGRGRPHNLTQLKSIVPTNATAVSALLNNQLGDLSSVTALVTNQSGEISGRTNQVVAVAVSSEKPPHQTVKPIIIKAQPGMSLVIVSQPNVNSQSRTVTTSKVELISSTSANVAKSRSHLPNVVSSSALNCISTTQVNSLVAANRAASIGLAATPSISSMRPSVNSERKTIRPSQVESTQVVKVYAVDPSKPNFVRITEQTGLGQAQVTMHSLSSKEHPANSLMNKTTFATAPGLSAKTTMVQLVPTVTSNQLKHSSSNSSSLSSHPPPTIVSSSKPLFSTAGGQGAQANLFLSSASPSPVKSIKSTSANQIVAANVTSSKDPTDTKNGPSVDCSSCKLKGLVSCKGCGAFCHHDCINSSNLCVSCLIR
ncbi:putative Polycomb group protein ASXL2 isoform X8 [Apostichopus japonicus]|uniref:Putative Polycomb group protein ASXL2 isoform X8 n=1 Tax=Stichopus japonicus TaxID=307972 RepID=A0A2G8LMF4_STIJA|nr:putative Polycomb group protein ASXL2 isoform X8 [Apostichopus japonicus]